MRYPCAARFQGAFVMKMLERLMGPPMAAPETRGLRRLRWFMICGLETCAVQILLLGWLIGLFGRFAIGAAVAISLTVTIVATCIYLIRKSRADDRWLLSRGFGQEGEGA
jgi:hypothetical protein